MKMIKPLLFASTVSAFALQVQAANVNAILSWEDVRYNDEYNKTGDNTGQARNYHGYRLDTTISPDNQIGRLVLVFAKIVLKAIHELLMIPIPLIAVLRLNHKLNS
ncbi:hypothetical protein JO83_07760 [Avibacterium paragallinarum]|nr:hypothetical protein JO83_07760 [Avibacterium paragallinarum]